MEIHKDCVKPKSRALIVDDLLATGGTALAIQQLLNKCDILTVGYSFVIELEGLKGRERLEAVAPVHALLTE